MFVIQGTVYLFGFAIPVHMQTSKLSPEFPRVAVGSVARGHFGVVFESHDTAPANVQQVADLQNQRVLVLVEPSVSVGDLPQQSDYPCFLTLGKVFVQELCEIMQMHDVPGTLGCAINKVGRMFR